MEDQKQLLIREMGNVYDLYIKYGSRSNKNVNYFHNFIKNELEKIFIKPLYEIKLEFEVKSSNSLGKKKCDIVVLKNNEPFIIFPVKIIKSNYKQNKNNGWENLTGELQHLKWSNDDIYIIPINIFMNKTPYLNDKKIITKFENITIDDINIYNILIEKNIAYDLINYILIVNHNNIIDEEFDKPPIIIDIDSTTPFRNLNDIVKDLL